MHRIIVPGSFDPPTNGHYDLIKRASSLADRLLIVISVNPRKSYLFSDEERKEMMEELLQYSDIRNAQVYIWDHLIVKFAEQMKAWTIVRGIRNEIDFSYELEISIMNRGLNKKIETLFLPTNPNLSVLRSSSVKELVFFGGDVQSMVPPPVLPWLKEKMLFLKKELDKK